jgi:flagellar basal-body rod protein FlgG
MSYQALAIGATGMEAHQKNVDTIADNLANANTPGFKKGRVGFVDLMLRETARLVDGSTAAAPVAAGVGIGSIIKVFDAGDLRKTDAPLDVAIAGQGFFMVTQGDGTTAYTRGGSLKVKDGLLCAPSGQPLRPEIRIPDNAKNAVVARDGRITITIADSSQPVDAGQLELVRFANPSGLESLGEGLYRATEASGEAQAVRATEQGAGAIVQGFVEGSNVRMVDEMVNLMLAQRAYEASLKVVQSADEMLGMINNLRK